MYDQLAKPLGHLWDQPTAKSWNAGLYHGLPIHADSIEVHEAAASLLQKHARRQDLILDVGAGSGAFCQRLVHLGFDNVQAVELRAEAFKVHGVPVHALDLNGPWGERLPCAFDALVALEVLEHLENPWHFARQCAAALRPGGVLVLSTPNIQSSRSRIEFLLRAEFRFFGQRDFDAVGHITSLTSEQIRRVCGQAGLDFVEHTFSRHKGMYRPTNFKRVLRALLYAASYPFMQGAKKGEESLFLFRKHGPATLSRQEHLQCMRFDSMRGAGHKEPCTE